MKNLLGLLGVMLTTSLHADIRSELAALYPHLGAAEISEKIRNNDSAFDFFRTFVAYYYDWSAREGVLDVASLAQVREVRGWCAGDAHLENFGSIMDRDGLVHFRVNDKDDAGPCPVALDLLRFLTSLQLSRPARASERVTALLAAYRSGLAAEPRNPSRIVEDLLAKALRKGPKPKNSLDEEKRKENGRDLSADEMSSLREVMAEHFGNDTEVGRAFAFIPVRGGSSHLLRYRTELRFSEANSWLPSGAPRDQVIELKSLVRPGVFPSLGDDTLPNASERITRSFAIDEGARVSPLFQVANWQAREMLLRPRWGAHIGIEMKDIDDERAEVALLEDEAYALGLFHRGSTDAVYLDKLGLTRDQDWRDAAMKAATQMDRAFAATREAR